MDGAMTKHCVYVQLSDYAKLHAGAEAHGTLAHEHLPTSSICCGLFGRFQGKHLNSVEHIVIKEIMKPIEHGDVKYEIQQEKEKVLPKVAQNPTRPVLYNLDHTEVQKPERRAMLSYTSSRL